MLFFRFISFSRIIVNSRKYSMTTVPKVLITRNDIPKEAIMLLQSRNGGNEVKLFTSALKAFQCNNRTVMAQRKHLDDFLRGRIIGRLECGRTQLGVSGIAQSVISRLWQ
ncbi:transposable element Tcb1 transposase [Trichonephila clavipes]|nr:transposable element Tcb1 transposase [Trichonephila clavipes]